MKNLLVSGDGHLGVQFLPDNADLNADGHGCGAGSGTALRGGGFGSGRHAIGNADGNGVVGGSIRASNADGYGKGFELHYAVGLLHSGGLDDIREFTSFQLLQPLIHRAQLPREIAIHVVV